MSRVPKECSDTSDKTGGESKTEGKEDKSREGGEGKGRERQSAQGRQAGLLDRQQELHPIRAGDVKQREKREREEKVLRSCPVYLYLPRLLTGAATSEWIGV